MNPTIPPGMELNEKDFELLLEALEAWVQEPASAGASSSLIGAIFGDKDREDRKRKMMQEMEEAQRKSKGRASTAIILRAKLELGRQGAQAAALAGNEEGGAH